MRSSTSSSDERLPRGGWARAWCVAAVLFVISLGAWEAFWRTQGFRTRVDAVDESWMLAMRAVPAASTVVLGTSRIQAALDPEAFASTAGGSPPVNLSLPGSSPIPLLEHLADETSYAGVVLVEVLPLFIFDGTRDPERRVRALLATYETRRVSPAKLSEDWLSVHLLRHCAFRSPALRPRRLAATLVSGDWPQPIPMRLRPDRFGPIFHRERRQPRQTQARAAPDAETYRIARNAGRPADAEEMREFVRRIERAVARIQGRGGRVVLAHLPAWGERREIEEARYPRVRYWGRLAAETSAIAINAADHPELAAIECPDGSHVDAADAARYAAILGQLVRQRLDETEPPRLPDEPR